MRVVPTLGDVVADIVDGDHPLGQGQQHEENDGEGGPTAEIQGV